MQQCTQFLKPYSCSLISWRKVDAKSGWMVFYKLNEDENSKYHAMFKRFKNRLRKTDKNEVSIFIFYIRESWIF